MQIAFYFFSTMCMVCFILHVKPYENPMVNK